MALLRPIQGTIAMQFWSSSNLCNRLKAICAYSLDKADANRNLTRFGYTNNFRKKVLRCRGITFNNPTMSGIPYNKGNVPMWVCLNTEVVPGRFAVWDDALLWMDSDEWVEWIPDVPLFFDESEEKLPNQWSIAYDHS